MARRLRVEFSGACYHVLNRGNYRRGLFARPDAADSFQRCLGEACESFGWLVHAFVIMRNHFHLAVETPEPNLSQGMKWLQGTWAQRFNRFRGLTGRPFQGRYKAWPIEPGHALAQVAHYIHLNPVRAGAVPVERLPEYRWSSLTLFPGRNRPRWLEPSTVLSESGGLRDTPGGWSSYRDYLGVVHENDPRFRTEKFAALTRTWAIGSAAFRAEIRTKLQEARRTVGRFRLAGADRELLRQARVEAWEHQLRQIADGFQFDLAELPRMKSAVEKLTLAAAMKQMSSASNGWLAQRLQMGSPDSIGSLLYRFRARGTTESNAFKSVMSQFLT